MDRKFYPRKSWSQQVFETQASIAHCLMCPYPQFGFPGVRDSKDGKFPTPMPLASTIHSFITGSLFAIPPVLEYERPIYSKLDRMYKYLLEPLLTRIRDLAGYSGQCFILVETDDTLYPKLKIYDSRNVWVHREDQGSELESAVFGWITRDPVTGRLMKNCKIFTKEYIYTWDPIETSEQETSTQAVNISQTQQSFTDVSGQYFTEKMMMEGSFELDEAYREPNKLGFVPVVVIENEDSPLDLSLGDFHRFRPILQRIDLGYHLMDISNQREAFPNLILLDIEDSSFDRELEVGDAMIMQSLMNEEGEQLQGKAQMLESTGSIKTHMEKYLADQKSHLFEAKGVVMARAEEVTNKGNMTPAVMSQMYAPVTMKLLTRRSSFGRRGILEILKMLAKVTSVATGLEEDGMREIAQLHPLDFYNDVQLHWFDAHFPIPELELKAKVDRILLERDANLIRPEDAVRKVAELERLPGASAWIDEMVKEYKDAKNRSELQGQSEARVETGNNPGVSGNRRQQNIKR